MKITTHAGESIIKEFPAVEYGIELVSENENRQLHQLKLTPGMVITFSLYWDENSGKLYVVNSVTGESYTLQRW